VDIHAQLSKKNHTKPGGWGEEKREGNLLGPAKWGIGQRVGLQHIMLPDLGGGRKTLVVQKDFGGRRGGLTNESRDKG